MAPMGRTQMKKRPMGALGDDNGGLISRKIAADQDTDQWNCSSSVEPVRAFTEDEPPWITVVTSSK